MIRFKQFTQKLDERTFNLDKKASKSDKPYIKKFLRLASNHFSAKQLSDDSTYLNYDRVDGMIEAYIIYAKLAGAKRYNEKLKASMDQLATDIQNNSAMTAKIVDNKRHYGISVLLP